MTEEWIVSALVKSTSGKHGIGLGTQNCLWADAKVFASNSEAGGNAIMFSMTQYALKLLVGKTFTSPVELNDWLWPQVWEYGKKVSANPDLRATYALNALVAVDNAVWVLFARENGLTSFDEMNPECLSPGARRASREVRVDSALLLQGAGRGDQGSGRLGLLLHEDQDRPARHSGRDAC